MAVLLAQRHEVLAVSTTLSKVDLINSGSSPIVDREISEYLKSGKLNLTATLDKEGAYKNAEIIVVATPTNYDPNLNFFDTSSVEEIIGIAMQVNPTATIVIKSTVPVGFTKSLREKYNCNN